MADVERIKERIGEIAGRRKNVTLADIEWVANQLEINGYRVSCRKNSHQRLYTVDGLRFGVCDHKHGGKQIKACYVDDFMSAMTELGLYEE